MFLLQTLIVFVFNKKNNSSNLFSTCLAEQTDCEPVSDSKLCVYSVNTLLVSLHKLALASDGDAAAIIRASLDLTYNL